MCSQRDRFFWIVVVRNYSSGGCAAVRLRCWQRMPFSFEVLHLASGKRVHNLAKKENFLFGSQPQAGFQWSGDPLILKYYTLQIQNSSSGEKRWRERERIIPTYFLKVQLDHSVKRACCTFPPTFWNGKSESSKSLSVCIINATRVKEAAVSTLRIQIFTWQHGQQKHMYSGHRYVSEHVWLTVYMVLIILWSYVCFILKAQMHLYILTSLLKVRLLFWSRSLSPPEQRIFVFIIIQWKSAHQPGATFGSFPNNFSSFL